MTVLLSLASQPDRRVDSRIRPAEPIVNRVPDRSAGTHMAVYIYSARHSLFKKLTEQHPPQAVLRSLVLSGAERAQKEIDNAFVATELPDVSQIDHRPERKRRDLYLYGEDPEQARLIEYRQELDRRGQFRRGVAWQSFLRLALLYGMETETGRHVLAHASRFPSTMRRRLPVDA